MTSMIMKYIIFSILLTIAAVFGVESAEGKEKLGTLSFYFENDFFGDTDRYYTNGIKLSWISPDLTSYAQSGKLPEGALPIVHWLPFINDQGLQRNIGLSMGQNIYTPRETERKDLIIDDRPYAGLISLKKTILTGVGLAVMTRDKVEELAKNLTEKGECLKRKGKS